MVCSTSCLISSSPSMAMAMTRPERAVTSWMLLKVFSYFRTLEGSLGSLVAMQTTETVTSVSSYSPENCNPEQIAAFDGRRVGNVT